MTDVRIAQLQKHTFRYIVILGSGHISDRRLPVTSRVGGSSLYRLVEGIRLLHRFPETKLVISGGIGYDPVPNADVVSAVASDIGVPAEKMIIENRPRDTMEEAELLHTLLGDDEFILVTSALHMPRAMMIFESHGMRPVPAPTDYILKADIVRPAGDIFPSLGNLALSERIMYEWIGDVWMTLKKNFSSSR